MDSNRVTLTIHTCEKFSDIWEVSLGLINKNWSDRNMRTMLVTDSKTDRQFKGIEVVSAGEGLDMPARTRKILSDIKTKYVFFTLDDYFLVDKINTEKISTLLDLMDKHNIDYLSFKNHHKTDKLIDAEEDVYRLDLNSGEDYIVNLYPGIWRTSFLAKTLEQTKNIWDYEVSLTSYAIAENATCCVSKGNQFPIMDGIRKGKFLHKSYRYLKENNLYSGNRAVISYKTEVKLYIMDQAKILLPKKMSIIVKKILKRFGFKFFS